MESSAARETAVSVESLLQFQDTLQTLGFDICGSFRVGDYNTLVGDRWAIEDFGNADCLGFVVGSSRAVWDHSKAWNFAKIVAGQPLTENPFDDYCSEAVSEAIISIPGLTEYDVYFDWNSKRPCHIQTAGHLAGLAHYHKSVIWSVHPIYGIWFAFRAVIIFANVTYPAGLPVPSEVPAYLTEDMIHGMHAIRDEFPNWWKDLEMARRYRNLVKAGADIEYSDEQLGYHVIGHSDPSARANYLLDLYYKSKEVLVGMKEIGKDNLENNIYEVIARSRYSEEIIPNYISNPVIGKASIWDPLGNKLSANEKVPFFAVDPDKYFTIRLDGKTFSKVAPKLKALGVFEKEGYSDTFENFMNDLALYLAKHFADTLYIFTQSDEITLLLDKCRSDKNGNPIAREFNGRRDKLVSYSSSLASTRFYRLVLEKFLAANPDTGKNLLDMLPEMTFDARIGQYATVKEAFELILWRSFDCSVNGISSAIFFAPGFPSKKTISEGNSRVKLGFLHEKGMLPLREHQAYGSFYRMEIVPREVVNKMTGETTMKDEKQFVLIPGPVIRNVKEGVVVL